MLSSRTEVKLFSEISIGKEATVIGWVNTRRDHGKLIFVDLRDQSGILQVVFAGKNKELFSLAETLRSEWVVKITGIVQSRPAGTENPEMPNGKIELFASELEVLNQSAALPFDINGNGYEIGEEHRLKYRYLDLRRQRLLKNLESRHKIILFIRNWLSGKGFVEVETPILTRSTPEGARDYLVPSRIEKGKFYALPQSPQQYKQLLMVSGVEKYFQIARCFRDEDTRGDRQPEFTQLDMEMSFVEREDVMRLNEEILIDSVRTVYPQKTIQEIPFPRLTYKYAMENYGTDRPDLRKDKNDPNLLAFCWVIDFPFFERAKDARNPIAKCALGSKVGLNSSGDESPKWTFTHNPFSAAKPEFSLDLLNKRNIENILASQYDITLNGFEIGGGSIRNHQSEALEAVFEIMGFEKERIHKDFGHMLEAFAFGAPPHGGIAWGLDRLIAILNNEPNIREVIAFPKTGDGRDLMMRAPSDVDNQQLKELGIKSDKK